MAIAPCPQNACYDSADSLNGSLGSQFEVFRTMATLLISPKIHGFIPSLCPGLCPGLLRAIPSSCGALRPYSGSRKYFI